jgi:WhiB family redox-sensing transcriptional regulator
MPLGACHGEDPELFFPAAPAGTRPQTDAAKEVCGRCLVRGECLAYALVTCQPDGIWGGTTQDERWGAGGSPPSRPGGQLQS